MPGFYGGGYGGYGDYGGYGGNGGYGGYGDYGGYGGNGGYGDYGGYGGYNDDRRYGGYDDSYSGYGSVPYSNNMYSMLSGFTSGVPDHLAMTKSKIDDYLAKTQQLGNRKLSVQVDYLNSPLEYQYLNQYHGFQHPLAGTSLGDYFNVPRPATAPPPQLFQAPNPPVPGWVPPPPVNATA